MTNFHPDDDLLARFCDGQHDDIHLLMISAHVSNCERCRQKVEEIQAALALQAMHAMPQSEPAALPRIDVQALIADLPHKAQPEQIPSAAADQAQTPVTLQYNNRTVEVPRAMAPLISRSGPWTRLVNRLWRSSVHQHGLPYQIDFLYIEAGGSIPAHNHQGQELTLVLDGSFCDERGDYQPGDFIACRGEQHHRPYSAQGCLCLAAIDAPLHFVSGFARLLNPFSQLFFKPAVKTLN